MRCIQTSRLSLKTCASIVTGRAIEQSLPCEEVLILDGPLKAMILLSSVGFRARFDR